MNRVFLSDSLEQGLTIEKRLLGSASFKIYLIQMDCEWLLALSKKFCIFCIHRSCSQYLWFVCCMIFRPTKHGKNRIEGTAKTYGLSGKEASNLGEYIWSQFPFFLIEIHNEQIKKLSRQLKLATSVRMKYFKSKRDNLTDPFTILELHNSSYDAPEQHKIPLSPDREATNIVRGTACIYHMPAFADHLIPYFFQDQRKRPPAVCR